MAHMKLIKSNMPEAKSLSETNRWLINMWEAAG